MFSENKLAVKAKSLYETVYSKLEELFSNKYYLNLLFLLLVCYWIFVSFKSHISIEHFYFSLATFVFSLIAIFLMFKLNRFYPFISLGVLLVFFSFFSQRFDLLVEYNFLYFLGFGLVAASVVYSLLKQNNKFFWISMFLLFLATLIPLISPQILIGDERILLGNLTKLESGKFLPSDFGKHNYVNVSFVYFYYLIIIAKIFGTSVVNIFFFLKFFFLVLIFLSFYLLATRFVDKKLALFVVLISFFPIQNLHLAPQMIGKFIVFLVFIYFYLKYFKQLNSRIILVVMMLLITYINLTTLYISLAVFGFFVFVFFFRKAISRKAYFTDLVILFLFVVLVGTYSSSIDLFGLAGQYSDVSEIESIATGKENIVREEDLSSRVDPFEQQTSSGPKEKEVISEEKYEEVPFIRRLVPFVNSYAEQYGITRLIEKITNYSLLVLLVLTSFFLFPKSRQIFIFSMAVFFLVLFLIHIQFHDGVHATLELTSLVFGVCIVLIFYRKPLYFIPLMLLFFSIVSAPLLFETSQYGEASAVFATEFSSRNLIGEKLTPVSYSSILTSEKYQNNSGFVVSCIQSKPYEVYLNDVYVRCDDFSRIGSIGTKIYENQYSKTYIVSAIDLPKKSNN